MVKAVNNKKLKALLAEAGEDAKLRLVVESKLSFSTLEKLCAGNYPNRPKARLRESLCEGLGKILKRKIFEEEIFPAVKGKAS